ncbi:hypothetical protein [Mycobacterium uberis]|uniref:hypothetical protein n=1 Tax=Mycobacterium uberis TaxID=2162698 RepID=UPI001FB471D3|nr:hypothetical protein [Mycobacterium uberis]
MLIGISRALGAGVVLVTGASSEAGWSHQAKRAMACVNGLAESSVLAAAVCIVQLASAAFGAGPVGVVVDTAKAGEAAAAR